MADVWLGRMVGADGEDWGLDLADYDRTGLRIGIFGASGAGKGWLLGLALEQFHALGLPIIALDPESELWTLQEIGALVLGGPHADAPIPLGAPALREVMEFAIQTVTPVVFDLGTISDDGPAAILAEGERLMRVFNAMSGTLRQRVVFAATEAELFAPQVVPSRGTQPQMLAAIQKRGRKRGVIPILETQRAADIAKSVISQCNVRFIGHLDEPLDFDAVKRHIPSWSFGGMRALATGRFIVTPLERSVVVGERSVTHGGATPLAGEVQIARRATSAELQALVERLRTVTAAATPPPEEGTGQAQAAVDGAARAELERLRTALAEVTRDRDAWQGVADQAQLQTTEALGRLAAAERAEALLGAFRAALIPLLGEGLTLPASVGPVEGGGGPGLTEADVVRLIARHAPQGGAVPAVLPVEALRTRYLEQTALRLVETIRGLEADEREVLLFLLAQGGRFVTINAVAKALSHSDSGAVRERWGKASGSLVAKGLATIGGSGRMGRQEAVGGWVRSALGPHNPSDAEVEQVKARALAVLMEAGR